MGRLVGIHLRVVGENRKGKQPQGAYGQAFSGIPVDTRTRLWMLHFLFIRSGSEVDTSFARVESATKSTSPNTLNSRIWDRTGINQMQD